MTEYITKSQALEIVKHTSGDYAQAFAEISRLPAADVVEVVRCEDCKHRRTISGEGWGIDTELYYCGENEILVSLAGYCSDGKSKDGGESNG